MSRVLSSSSYRHRLRRTERSIPCPRSIRRISSRQTFFGWQRAGSKHAIRTQFPFSLHIGLPARPLHRVCIAQRSVVFCRSWGPRRSCEMTAAKTGVMRAATGPRGHEPEKTGEGRKGGLRVRKVWGIEPQRTCMLRLEQRGPSSWTLGFGPDLGRIVRRSRLREHFAHRGSASASHRPPVLPNASACRRMRHHVCSQSKRRARVRGSIFILRKILGALDRVWCSSGANFFTTVLRIENICGF